MTQDAEPGRDDRAKDAGSVVPPRAMLARALGALHTDAMILADEAYTVFSRGLEDDAGLPPTVRVGLSCEALKTTTRLMHVIAWLLDQRSVMAGEWTAAVPPTLGPDVPADAGLCAHLPPAVADIVRASERLAARARALEGLRPPRNEDAARRPTEGPARALQARLAGAL